MNRGSSLNKNGSSFINIRNNLNTNDYSHYMRGCTHRKSDSTPFMSGCSAGKGNKIAGNVWQLKV